MREAVLDGDVVADAALDTLTDLETDFDSVIDADVVFVSVGSRDGDTDPLRLPVELIVSDGSVDVDAVVDGVKLGETGLFVTEGVIDGDGIISV